MIGQIVKLDLITETGFESIIVKVIKVMEYSVRVMTIENRHVNYVFAQADILADETIQGLTILNEDQAEEWESEHEINRYNQSLNTLADSVANELQSLREHVPIDMNGILGEFMERITMKVVDKQLDKVVENLDA